MFPSASVYSPEDNIAKWEKPGRKMVSNNINTSYWSEERTSILLGVRRRGEVTYKLCTLLFQSLVYRG